MLALEDSHGRLQENEEGDGGGREGQERLHAGGQPNQEKKVGADAPTKDPNSLGTGEGGGNVAD